MDIRNQLVVMVHALTIMAMMVTSMLLMLKQFQNVQQQGSGTINESALGKHAAFLYVFSIVNYFLVGIIVDRWTQLVWSREQIVVTSGSYVKAGRWILMPFLGSAAITGATYIIGGYEGSIPNHATVFGVYLTILLLIKDKVSALGRDRETRKKK